jgi:UDP-4-amino-4,6-dideoxy-N-acetyl-beta-L-altrosamine N-acetyltransferase
VPLRDECRLRPPVASEADTVFEWRNSERVWRMLFTDHVITPEEHQAWFHKVLEASPASVMIFEFRDKPAGVVSIDGIDLGAGRCRWGFYLGVDGLPKGTGRAMCFLWLDELLVQRGMRKVCGEVFARNERSVRLHEALGFAREGLLKAHVCKAGVYEDVILLARFREDWQREREAIAAKVFHE